QIDHGCRRLLHVSRDRTTQSFNTFFDTLGKERAAGITFVASDMWAAFLKVVRSRCSAAVHVLDRFHVMQLMNKAIDQTRRDEVRQLRAKGKTAVLTKTRWVSLKWRRNLTGKQRIRLRELLQWNLRTVRTYLLKEAFQHFWTYKAVWAARRFLKEWTHQAMRSRNDHIKKSARTLRKHEPELLNWFRARGQFAAGATEGFNNKARITTRKAYGFRTYKHAEIALYHGLGDLPKPDWLAHRFV
ncbi:transposase, partial [Myxococcota bacterium]